MNLNQWAQRWNIPAECLHELDYVLTNAASTETDNNTSYATESAVQQAIRLRASKRGCRLWRNNRGAVTTNDGRHIRFGLANDSTKINSVVKSSDLIGVTPVIVKDSHVGQKLGIFTSIEVKAPGWVYTGGPHEEAQRAWINAIQAMGGFASVATSENIIDTIDN